MNFDQIIDRRGTGAIKWDRRPELDPYWVADMDFRSPDCVIEAIRKCADHGIFGYTNAFPSLEETIQAYLKRRHLSTIHTDSIVHIGGLVCALSIACRAFAKAGEAVMTCTPVYPPFLSVSKDAGARTIAIPHNHTNGRFSFDFEAMEESVTADTKLFMLCNPQNPLGRSFTSEEVTAVAEFCHRHDLVLISDEIHCDLVYNEDEAPFFSALQLPEHLRQKLIVLLSPSKTYNIAGLGYAYAVIENDSTRRTFTTTRGHTLPEINSIAFYTAEAAYKHGEPWRQELLAYLRKNRDTITSFVREQMPYLTIPDMEATYLAWLDATQLPLDNPANYLEEKAKIFLSDGSFFGAKKTIRFNFGCPHSRLLEGLEKIKATLDPIA